MSMQPQSIASSLYKRMLQYQFKKTIPPLVIEGFKRDANKLIKHDAQSAYDLLGVIASLENKRENVISNYKKAIGLGNNPYVYYNFAVSLNRDGEVSLSLENLKEGMKLIDPLDLDLLQRYHHAFMASLSINELRIINKKLAKLNSPEDKHFKLLTNFFNQNNFNLELIEMFIIKVGNIIYNNNLISAKSTYFEYNGDSLYMILNVESENISDVVNCNFDISDMKIEFEDEFNINLNNFIVSCEVMND